MKRCSHCLYTGNSKQWVLRVLVLLIWQGWKHQPQALIVGEYGCDIQALWMSFAYTVRKADANRTKPPGRLSVINFFITSCPCFFSCNLKLQFRSPDQPSYNMTSLHTGSYSMLANWLEKRFDFSTKFSKLSAAPKVEANFCFNFTKKKVYGLIYSLLCSMWNHTLHTHFY